MTTALSDGQVSILTIELNNDPLHRSYASMTDATAAADINTVYRNATVDIPVATLRQYILINGVWPALAACAASTTNPAAAGAAATVIQTIAPGAFGVIETSKGQIFAAFSSLTNAMVQAEVITQMQGNQILGLSSGRVSRATELGLPPIFHQDIAWSRGIR